jgi:hypothetical protein
VDVNLAHLTPGTPWHLDLRAIATPIQDCISLRVGSLDEAVIAALEAHHYDQAPVVDVAGNTIGVLDIAAARARMGEHRDLEETDPAIERRCLPVDCAVESILEIMSEAAGVLVEEEAGTYYGLLTASDLNRHRFRSILYGAFAELESLLARLADMTFPDPWEWLSRLGDDAQARLVGYWELGRRRNVDIGPLAACTLTELLKIVAHEEALRTMLGWHSRQQFDKSTGSLPDLRNRVMHPVRPLILGREEVSRLAASVQVVRELAGRSRSVLAERGLSSHVHWL